MTNSGTPEQGCGKCGKVANTSDFPTLSTSPTGGHQQSKCVTYVSEHLLPMSSVHTLREEGKVGYADGSATHALGCVLLNRA
jgi:hypothetical protein